MSDRMMLTGGHIVTMDEEIGEIRRGDILVLDGQIAAVGPDLAVTDAETVDVSGSIVMPGMIDTHRHTWQTVLRGFGADFTAQQYRSCIRGHFGQAFRPSDVYASTLLGALEALDSGVTTLVDWAHITNTPQHADASIDALTAAGIRAVYAHGTPNDGDTAAWYDHSQLRHPDDIRRVREQRLPGEDGLVTMAMAARPPHIVTRDVMVHDWAVARELGLRVTCDGGLGGGSWGGVLWGDGGHQPISALVEEGLLDERVTLVHCNNLPDEDLKAIAKAGAYISISPDSEMHVGHGLPVTGRAFAAGIRPALSTDIQIQVAGDLFGAMRSLIAAERGRLGTQAYDAGLGPDDWSISTRDVLGFATVQGARATGLGTRVGTISPGKRADLCVLRGDALNLRPTNNAIGIVVLQAHPGNVSDVMVGGRFAKRNGRMLADTDAVIGLADESRDYLFQAAGLEPGWGYQPALQPEWRW